MTSAYFPAESVFDKGRLYRRITFMGLSAVTASGAIIAYFNRAILSQLSDTAYAGVELAVMTLMPYMISAVIATITAIAVMSVLSTTRVAAPAEKMILNLREMADGDLSVRMRLEGDDPLKEVGTAFNSAVSNLSDRVAHWKIVNRQQWGVLCRIRQAVESNDPEQALRFVAEMEQNWDRIAEIENQLIS
jgi:methyl-accepting chemotaxis protein